MVDSAEGFEEFLVDEVRVLLGFMVVDLDFRFFFFFFFVFALICFGSPDSSETDLGVMDVDGFGKGEWIVRAGAAFLGSKLASAVL